MKTTASSHNRLWAHQNGASGGKVGVGVPDGVEVIVIEAVVVTPAPTATCFVVVTPFTSTVTVRVPEVTELKVTSPFKVA